MMAYSAYIENIIIGDGVIVSFRSTFIVCVSIAISHLLLLLLRRANVDGVGTWHTLCMWQSVKDTISFFVYFRRYDWTLTICLQYNLIRRKGTRSSRMHFTHFSLSSSSLTVLLVIFIDVVIFGHSVSVTLERSQSHVRRTEQAEDEEKEVEKKQQEKVCVYQGSNQYKWQRIISYQKHIFSLFSRSNSY